MTRQLKINGGEKMQGPDLRSTLLRYCRSLKSESKQVYAIAYVAHQLRNGVDAPPPYSCSAMAAQAVRMNVNEIFRRAGH